MYVRHYILLIGLILVGCQADVAETPTATPSDEVVNVQELDNEFIVWGQSALTETIDLYMEQVFEERHPDIDVVFVDAGWDEALRQNLDNAIQMGRPPDVVIGENYFRSFAKAGHLQPISDLIDVHDDVIPATYSGARYDGDIYAVPFLTGVFGFERNCEVIEASGLDCDSPPQTWDDLLDETDQINQAGAGRYFGYTMQGPGGTAVGAAFRIAVYQAQLDALPCADDACTVPDFNRPETLPVYEFLRELAQYTPPQLLTNTNEGEVYEALFRGVSAYQIAGSWHPEWAQRAGCEDCRYSSIPYPREGHPSSLLVGNVLYAAPVNSQYPELAREWLSLLMSDDVQSMIFPESGRLPIRESILRDLAPTVDEPTAVFINEILDNDHLVLLPQWETNPRATWQIYNDLLEDVLLTNNSIEDAMRTAQTSVEALR